MVSTGSEQMEIDSRIPSNDEKVLINVGEDNPTIFKVSKSNICQKSPFFAAACNGNFREAKENLVRLPTDLPEAFAVFLSYINTGKLQVPVFVRFEVLLELFKQLDKFQIAGFERLYLTFLIEAGLKQTSLVDVWLSARNENEVRLQDIATSAMHFCLSQSNQFLQDVTIKRIWKQGPSKLRQLVVDEVSFYYPHYRPELHDYNNPQDIPAILVEIMDLSYDGKVFRGRDAPLKSNPCVYHEHAGARDEGCPFGGVWR